ncbi:MAG: hypothetical protein ACYDDB_01675 [bacterium]
MIDTVEIQQIITNLPSIEKIASTSQVLAVNSNNIIRKEMENAGDMNLNTVVELSEVLEPVNDKNKKSKEEEKEKKEGGHKSSEAEENKSHIDLVV